MAAGLIQKGQKGGHYDVFRSRITFPVRDLRGRTVGFGARASTPDQKPKYKNSAEGELYRKSRTLYGIDRARGPIARSDRAVVVEGYTDVLALHQAGIEETVAVMGTAITPDQLKMLSGFASEVVLALDADRAGREAMLRAQRVAGSGRLRLLVVAMPEGEDPAEMLAAEGGEERFRRLLSEAVDLPVFHVRAILGDADLQTPAGRDRALDEVAPVLKAMGETITRQELVSEVADRLDTDPSLVGRRLAAAQMPKREEPQQRRSAPVTGGQPGPAGPDPGHGTTEAGDADGDGGFAGFDEGPPPDGAPAPEGPGGVGTAPQRAVRRDMTVEERREDAFLAMLIADPKLGATYVGELTEAHLVGPRARLALGWLRDHLKHPLDDLPRDNSELFDAVSRLTLLAEEQSAKPEDVAVTWRTLELARIDRELSQISRALAAVSDGTSDPEGEAEEPASGDVDRLQHRFRDLLSQRAAAEDAVHFRAN